MGSLLPCAQSTLHVRLSQLHIGTLTQARAPKLLSLTSSPVSSSILRLQPLLNTLHLLRIRNLNNPPRLALVAHQLLSTRVQHARFLVARRGQVGQHDVRHAEAAGGQRQRVGEQDEARGVVGQVVAEVLHRSVDLGGRLLVDFEGGFRDLVFFGGKEVGG